MGWGSVGVNSYVIVCFNNVVFGFDFFEFDFDVVNFVVIIVSYIFEILILVFLLFFVNVIEIYIILVIFCCFGYEKLDLKGKNMVVIWNIWVKF